MKRGPIVLENFEPSAGSLKSIPINLATNEGKRSADVMIYEPIGGGIFGDGLDAKRFAQQLDDLGEVDEIHVHINSPGGRIGDGLAMYNTLIQHPADIKVTIEGIAASSASWVAQAASPGMLNMCENAIMMIHCAQDLTAGDKREHAKTAQVLEKLDDTIARTYAARSGRRPATFLSMMEDETWMSAEEAVENKLADAVQPAKKVENCFDLAMLNRYHPPADLAQRLAAAGGGSGATTAEPLDRSSPPPASSAEADDDAAENAHQRAVAVRRRLLDVDADLYEING